MKRFYPAALLLVLALPARADTVRPLTDAETLKACGECHMAFQPGFLPARSWNRIMDTLTDHFGDNAGMAADKTARIRKVLVEGAADERAKTLRGLDANAVPLRLTETPRFVRKHDRIPERVWKRPDIVTKSNCVACHTGAEKGIYEDD
ncbi:MAG: diheme cytochrome c [Magnetospirillum sp.]|nr:diheme cytochrome c [Magnetospirillum sp.]